MKLVYTPGASIRCNPEHPVVPNFKVQRVDVVTSGGSSTPRQQESANVMDHSASVIEHNARLVVAGTPIEGIIFNSLDPGIATVDATGLIGWMSDGTARIRARIGPNHQGFDVSVSRQSPTLSTDFVSWVAGSLESFAYNKASETTLVSSVRSLFSGSLRNSSLFCASYAGSLSAVAKEVNGSSHIGLTAITARHAIGCDHAIHANGSTATFVDADSTAHTRTILASVRLIGYADTRVYLLSTDLPAEVIPLKLLDRQMTKYLRNPQFKVPLFFPDRDNLMNIGGTLGLANNEWQFGPPVSEFGEFYASPVDGTSGKPLLVPISPTEFALASTFFGSTVGPWHRILEISNAIASLEVSAGISTGYQPIPANLSAFTNFSP